MKILVLNAGSSSHKISLFEPGETLPKDPLPCLWQAKIEWHGDIAGIELKHPSQKPERTERKVSSHIEAVQDVVRMMWQGDDRVIDAPGEIDMVGHRIVHGGLRYEEPVQITPAVKDGIAGVAAFAPLHNRAELEGVEAIETLLGHVPQVAVFDTGFHRRMPLAAATYPGPYEWFTQDIRRYGFHGINHQYCAGRAAEILQRDLNTLRLVTCHLGNGCSLAAIQDGHSVDTTMGFTPLEGLMMGTRSGSVDPGIITYLLRQGQLQPSEIDDVLNYRSGLLGISGVSEDMREILALMQKGHSRAQLAFDIYIHRLQAGIGAMMAVLGGIDALVFTAGVGENSAEVREAACRPFAFLGLTLDTVANLHPSADADLAAADSAVRVLMIRAQEEWAIACECWKLRQGKPRI